MRIAVPAILPSSRSDFEKKLSSLSSISEVERIQIDVVDGKFAEPASWPYSASGELHAMVEKGEMLPHPDRISYEVDLMCIDPESAAKDWLALGANRLTFHAGSVTDLPRLLSFAKNQYGAGAGFAAELISFGVAVTIGSDIEILESCLSDIRYVQFMGIARIGRQGQPLDGRVFEKIRVFHERHPDMPIQVDGGVTLENAKKLLSLGVTTLVTGSAVAQSDNPSEVLNMFENLKTPFGV
jgi:ribulose-phosphate 3-epimerase